MEKVSKQRKAKQLVVRAETLKTLNDVSLKAVAGGLIPEGSWHCSGSGPSC
jgi:hypothetical protein